MTNHNQRLAALFPTSMQQRVVKRHRANSRFRSYGLGAIIVSIVFLCLLIGNIASNGYSAFWQSQVKLDIVLDATILVPGGGTPSKRDLSRANYSKLIQSSLQTTLNLTDEQYELSRRELQQLMSKEAAYQLRDKVVADPTVIGSTVSVWLLLDSSVDMYLKGRISKDTPESSRRLNDQQLGWIDQLSTQEHIRKAFNTAFFTSGDSRSPEAAGIWGSIVGSFFTIVACMLVALPLGVMTAIYLEEFAPKNWFTDLLEVNLNNLAAVPSIIFGLLGLAIFISLFGMPRSAPLVGGMTLALMVLPILVITTRNALKAVPPSIRDGAMALGASPMQVVLHHTLPLALPGIMTGTILSVARALGETAPLLMIGMVAFVVDIPQGFLSSASAMPVQIYLWADSPEMGFVERTSACILVLLFFLVVANLLAIYIRRKYEIRW